MAPEMSDEVRAAIDAPVFAHLSTIMRDGSPHVSAMWIDRDGDDILMSTAEGRLKTQNMRRDPRVAISVLDPKTPYRNFVLRGRVVEMTTDGNWLIDRLALKYLGKEQYPWVSPPRVNLRIAIDHVAG